MGNKDSKPIKNIKSKEKLNDETKDTTKDAKKDTTNDKTNDATKDTTKETRKEKIQENLNNNVKNNIIGNKNDNSERKTNDDNLEDYEVKIKILCETTLTPKNTPENSNGVASDITIKDKLCSKTFESPIPTTLKNKSNSEKRQKFKLESTGGSLNKDIRKVYKFKEVLGGGHFGTVRVAVRRSDPEPKKFYAVKSISKKNLTEKDFEDLMKEVNILSSLDHPNIIKFYETYHDELYFHIVMELCRGKEVFDKIIEEGNINENKVSIIIYKVLHTISYCHTAGITHRDLKPENILFETTEPDAEIKLIDFGLSRKYHTNEKMHTILGTPYYVSPEVLRGNYDERCDLWSIGALTYIMLCGEPPFNGGSNNEIFDKILNAELSFNKEKWKNKSSESKDFIKKCLVKQYEKRFTTKEAIDHQWFKNIHKEVHSSNNFNSEIFENLKNYSAPQKFQKMVLKFLVNQLSQNELKKLRQTFYAVDLDHTGFINKDELVKAFELAGISITQDEVNNILESGDNNSQLDYSEFLIASLNHKKLIDKEKLVSAFKYFDVDDSGYIDSCDLKNVLLRSGKQVLDEKEIDKVLAEVSPQKLSLQEFLMLFDYE